MIIGPKKGTKLTTNGVVWKFQNEEREYPVTSSACRNPLCGCHEMTFRIKSDSQGPTLASFEIDVNTWEMNAIDSESSDKKLSQQILSQISDDDKKTLTNLFYSHKIQCEKNTNLYDLEPPNFPVDEIENESVVTGYREIFPWSKEFSVTTGEKNFIVYDQYCLSTTCKCNDVVLSFMEFKDNVLLHDKDSATLNYNCQTGKWEVLEEQNNSEHPSHLMKVLFTKYPDYKETITERREKLKILYMMHMKSIGFLPNQKEVVQASKEVGRNDSCPCGSGKKYKKCCG